MQEQAAGHRTATGRSAVSLPGKACVATRVGGRHPRWRHPSG